MNSETGSSNLLATDERPLGYPGVAVRLLQEETLTPVELSPEIEKIMPERPDFSVDTKNAIAKAFRLGETRIVQDLSQVEDGFEYGQARAAAGIPIGDWGLKTFVSTEVDGIDPFDVRLGEVLAAHTEAMLSRLEREEALVEAKEEAQEAARLKSAMLANMSHEIRTPLTSIVGFAEVLEEALDGDLEIFASKIHGSSQRLQRTLDSVLHLSRLEAGVEEPKREKVSLGPVAEEVVEMLRGQAEEKSISLATETPDAPVVGDWNEDAVHRICRNLVENAIKFTSEGGKVRVRVDAKDERARLEVEDTGIGMNPEHVPDLFRAFKQESEGLDREYEGSGLGLSIVGRLVEELGGTIDVETEKGEGTCFTVQFPLGSPSANA